MGPKVQESTPPPKDPEVLESEDPVILVKRFILAELEAGREPTATEVAEHVGKKLRPLGVPMSRSGVQAKLAGMGNNKVRSTSTPSR